MRQKCSFSVYRCRRVSRLGSVAFVKQLVSAICIERPSKVFGVNAGSLIQPDVWDRVSRPSAMHASIKTSLLALRIDRRIFLVALGDFGGL